MSSTPDVLTLYSLSELREYETRIRTNLTGLWQYDFLSKVTHAESVRAGPVRLSTPLVSAYRYPIDFYSDPIARTVFLPISSVRFLDDMALAFAYYGKKGCDVGIVSDYAGVLRLRPQELQSSPLERLGVPNTVSKDQDVDTLAQKILKSTVFFVAAHEYAHVMYQHTGYKTITAQQAQQHETQADLFALEVMRRIGVAPVGVTYFFLVTSRLEPTPGDFRSLADYENYLRQRATHPVSALRLVELAKALENNVDAFARLQADPASWGPRLQRDVEQLRQIASTLDDRKIRDYLADRARTADVAAFRLACP